MTSEKSRVKDWSISIGAIIFTPYLVFIIAENIEKHFKIPFNYAFWGIWIIILLVTIVKFRKDMMKFVKSVGKFLYNLRYIGRLDEVEPFKIQSAKKILKKNKVHIMKKVHLKNSKKGEVNWGAVLLIILIILVIAFFFRQF